MLKPTLLSFNARGFIQLYCMAHKFKLFGLFTDRQTSLLTGKRAGSEPDKVNNLL